MSEIFWPLAENHIRRGSLANTYGNVRRNRFGLKRAHQGWDFFAPVGTPCFAIADGRVVLVYESPDYGKVLVASFRHLDRTLYAAYAHLNLFRARHGDVLQRGEIVGYTGDSGNARGMPPEDEHLHFEIRTEPRPGTGLGGRLSPMAIYGRCPLTYTARQR